MSLFFLIEYEVGNKTSSQNTEISTKQFSNLALMSLAVLLHAADATAVATLVPAIVRDIGGMEIIPWAVSLYEIGSIVAGAACGLLAINYGIRNPMVIAALLFCTGCVTSYLAPEMWIVLSGRLLQGLGGGGLVALSFVAINLLFHKSLIPRVLAAVSVVWGSSAFLGPLIGGLFVEYFSWREAFLFFSLISLLLAWLIHLAIRDEFRPDDRKVNSFPLFSLILLSAGVICIAHGGVNISLSKTPVFVAIGIAILISFVYVDSNQGESRLLPINPITLRTRVGAGLIMILCFTMSTIAVTVYGPYLVTQLHGVSLMVGGYIVACSSIGWAVAAFVVSSLDERNDRKMVVLGMTTLTISIIGFMFSVAAGPIWLVAAFAFLEGIGFGMAYAFIVRLITTAADKTEAERTSAAIPTVQRLGYAIGAAYVGIVANALGIVGTTDPETLTNVAFWIFAACLPIAFMGLLATVRFVKQ